MEFEGKDYSIVKLLSGLGEKYLVYLVLLCVGAVISVCGVIAPISTWILFPKSRNFQNFIALNCCFTSTLLCLLMCADAVFVYYLNNILCNSYRDNNMDDYIRISDQYYMLFQYILGLCGYAYISLCCWNTVESLFCLVSVMKIMREEVRWWIYIVEILFCYLAPAPLLVLQVGMTISSKTFITVMLSEIVVINVVTTCIYTFVAIAMFCGKKPGQGETVRTIIASLIIFIIFGFGYAVLYVINLWAELHKLITPSDTLENFAQHDKFALYCLLCLLISIMPLVLSAFYVCVRKDNKKFWTHYFTKTSETTDNQLL